MRHHGEHPGANGLDLFAEAAAQLFLRRLQRAGRAGADHVHHGLGLGEVHLAVDKGALGELPRLRRARTSLQHRLVETGTDQRAAVAVDLGHVFPGVTPGRGKDGEQPFVELFAVAMK